MKPTLEQVILYSQTDLEEPKPPNPYEISLALAAGLLAGGRYGESPEAAISAAWMMVVPYYEGRATYEANVRARMEAAEIARQARGGGGLGASFAAPWQGGDTAGPAEGLMAHAPGETGVAGEASGVGSTANMLVNVELPIPKPELVAKRNRIIFECNQRMAKADVALREAKALPPKSRGRRKAIDAAEAEWDQAAQAQSKAHEMPVA